MNLFFCAFWLGMLVGAWPTQPLAWSILALCLSVLFLSLHRLQR